LRKLLLRLGGHLRCRPLLGGHGAADRFDQLMLHMEEVRRVVCAEVMFNISQQARCFIAGRLNDLTVQTRKRLLHERMPRVLIAALCRLLQDDVVALGFHRHETKPACKRFILGQGDGFGGHVPCQPGTFLAAIRHDRLLHLPVDLVLRPISGADKAIETRELPQQTYQANATRPDFSAHQGEPEDQAMQEGKPRATVKKGHDGGMLVEALLVRPPCLKRAAGHVQSLGCLTQGAPLGLQIVILVKECSALGAIPAWTMSIVASLLVLDDSAHNDLLLHPSPLCRDG
jgi:hypothetical protein